MSITPYAHNNKAVPELVCHLNKLPKEVLLHILKFADIKDQGRVVAFKLFKCMDSEVTFQDIAYISVIQNRIVDTFNWAVRNNLVWFMKNLISATPCYRKASLIQNIGRCGKYNALEIAIQALATDAFRCLMIDFARYGFASCLYSFKDRGYNMNENLYLKALYANDEIRKITLENDK